MHVVWGESVHLASHGVAVVFADTAVGVYVQTRAVRHPGKLQHLSQLLSHEALPTIAGYIGYDLNPEVGLFAAKVLYRISQDPVTALSSKQVVLALQRPRRAVRDGIIKGLAMCLQRDVGGESTEDASVLDGDVEMGGGSSVGGPSGSGGRDVVNVREQLREIVVELLLRNLDTPGLNLTHHLLGLSDVVRSSRRSSLVRRSEASVSLDAPSTACLRAVLEFVDVPDIVVTQPRTAEACYNLMYVPGCL